MLLALPARRAQSARLARPAVKPFPAPLVAVGLVGRHPAAARANKAEQFPRAR